MASRAGATALVHRVGRQSAPLPCAAPLLEDGAPCTARGARLRLATPRVKEAMGGALGVCQRGGARQVVVQLAPLAVLPVTPGADAACVEEALQTASRPPPSPLACRVGAGGARVAAPAAAEEAVPLPVRAHSL